MNINFKMISFSKSTKNNMMTCTLVLVVVGLLVWYMLKPSCPQQKIVVPIGNGKSVSLTKEQYQRLLTESYRGREGFYVSSQDYIPNVRTENEYTPMLSLYKPKEPTRVVPEPPSAPVAPITPVPVPVPMIPSMTGATGATGPAEGYGLVFLDNYEAPQPDAAAEKYRLELTGQSPFFLNNGKIMNGEAI